MELIRAQYPHHSGEITYFDSAGRSVLPQSVEDVGIAAVKQKSQPWKGVGSDSDISDVRRLFAELIGCQDQSCIALNPSTGFAMSLVAKNVVDTGKLASDKTVILLDKEMGSVVYPWQEACKKTGARIKVIQDPLLTDAGGTWTDAVIAAIDDNVAVLALPAVHWCNGALINLKAVSTALARYPKAQRPLLVVDGTQSIGAQAFNVCEIEADFVACSVHKWLNCPYGMSLVYVKSEYHSIWLPLDQHERGRVGSNQEGWDEIIFMVKQTGFYPSELFADARRFDAGGKANPVTVPMVRAGLQTVLQWGPALVQAHTATLTDLIAQQLQHIFGADVIIRSQVDRSAHILSVRFSPRSVLHAAVPLIALNAELKRNNVFASVRGEWLRLSVYLHNNTAEVNRFVSLLVYIVNSLVLLNARDVVKYGAGKRVLVTGAAGWLGQYVTHSMLGSFASCVGTATDSLITNSNIMMDVYAAYSRAVPHWVPADHRVHLDLNDIASIRAAIEVVRPDIIIHTAAISAPIVCHKDVRHAYAVNCPEMLINLVQEVVPECLFLFTSTDMVYDGESAPYKASALDSAQSAPVNVYGETKLAFEKQVLRLKYGTVLRLSNMIGAPYKYMPAGVKFLEWVHSAYKKRDFIGLKGQEIRSFVHVQDVVKVLSTLTERYCRGDHAVWSNTAAANTATDGATAADTAVADSHSEGTSGCCRGDSRVLNVGGPQPLSRLDIARSLCTALGGSLVVDPAPRTTGANAVVAVSGLSAPQEWSVYVMDAPCADNSPPQAPVQGELRSPRDISMDSSATEEVLGFKFAAVDSVLLASLSVS